MYSKETKIFIVLLLATILLAIIIGYYVYTIVKAHKNEILRRKKFLFDEINVLEKERERIAQNLHDSAGPELSLLKLNLDEIYTEEQDALSNTKSHIDKILTDLRHISHNLMPSSLIREGLVPAVEDLARRMSNRALTIECMGEIKASVPKELAIHLYRMLEEFIYNTIKHAKASRMKIQFIQKNESIEVIARDNGIGFDMKQYGKTSDGIGLRGFEYRTEMIGGTCTLYSEPGKGTQIHIVMPITKQS